MIKTKEQIAKDLRELAGIVESGDSFEGSYHYSCLQEAAQPGQFEVTAAIRVGNLEGQGGMRIIEPAQKPETEATGDGRRCAFTFEKEADAIEACRQLNLIAFPRSENVAFFREKLRVWLRPEFASIRLVREARVLFDQYRTDEPG
jgi:hypothetical protein